MNKPDVDRIAFMIEPILVSLIPFPEGIHLNIIYICMYSLQKFIYKIPNKYKNVSHEKRFNQIWIFLDSILYNMLCSLLKGMNFEICNIQVYKIILI